MVLSDRNLSKLLNQHQLYDDQAADPAGALDSLSGDIKVDIVTVPILDPNTGRERDVVTAFSVAYDNPQPKRAQEGAEWLVIRSSQENRNDRQRQAAGKAKFFAREAERMRVHVAGLEAKLADFKQKNAGKLPELNEINMNVMERTENDIQNVESQMQALRRERVFLVAQLQQARAAGPETGNLRALEDEYNRKSMQYDQSHPDLIMLRRQIDQLRARRFDERHVAAGDSCNSSVPFLPRRSSVTAKIIRTCSASLATSRRWRRASPRAKPPIAVFRRTRRWPCNCRLN